MYSYPCLGLIRYQKLIPYLYPDPEPSYGSWIRPKGLLDITLLHQHLCGTLHLWDSVVTLSPESDAVKRRLFAMTLKWRTRTKYPLKVTLHRKAIPCSRTQLGSDVLDQFWYIMNSSVARDPYWWYSDRSLVAINSLWVFTCRLQVSKKKGLSEKTENCNIGDRSNKKVVVQDWRGRQGSRNSFLSSFWFLNTKGIWYLVWHASKNHTGCKPVTNSQT